MALEDKTKKKIYITVDKKQFAAGDRNLLTNNSAMIKNWARFGFQLIRFFSAHCFNIFVRQKNIPMCAQPEF
jgi:hypothetical protein